MVTSGTSVRSTRWLLSCGRTLSGKVAGQRHAGVGELVRHAVLAHRDFDLHAGVVDLAQHFLDAPDRLAEQRRRLGQFDHHHLAGLGRAGGAFGNQHILAVTLVFGRHQPDAAFLQQAADDDWVLRSMISTTRPSGRPLRSLRTMRALTRSLCSTARISLGGR